MSSLPSFVVSTLGPCRFDSPITDFAAEREHSPRFVGDDARVLFDDHIERIDPTARLDSLPAFERAGPRRRLFFNPRDTRIGIVTCGGLCPGLNDVIRGLVMVAWHRYGVRHVYGFRYGYRGFIPPSEPIKLDPELVSEIHETGGSMLASSRGKQDTNAIVDCLVELGVNILFTIGGDGTLRGALAISDEIRRAKLDIAVVGIPKTIDNDISYIDQSFGFETAFTEAVEAISSAHAEARGTYNGIGLVKVMGRHSGFLACHAAMASSHVNFCLIPEMPLGSCFADSFTEALCKRLERRKHAVILVAEGAGQEQLQQSGHVERDASGNVKLVDIGRFLADRITDRLTQRDIEFSLKYIDPSYMVRSVPATPADSIYCWRLAQAAVHAAMAGKTDLIVGLWHGRMVHVPIAAAISKRKLVDPQGDLWLSVLETTGQPAYFE